MIFPGKYSGFVVTNKETNQMQWMSKRYIMGILLCDFRWHDIRTKNVMLILNVGMLVSVLQCTTYNILSSIDAH